MTERDAGPRRGNHARSPDMPLAPRPTRLRFWLPALLAAAVLLPARAEILTPLDEGWRFHNGDEAGAQASRFNDHGWRSVDLPHDWSIEGAPAADAPSLGGEGFYPTGIGWYRIHVAAPEVWRGKRVWVEFDGAYRDSDVWLNGAHLARRPSGFASFRCDLTPHLHIGADNVIAVRIDNSEQPNSRYYTGSGLYRHVRLRIADPLHVAPDGLAVSTRSLSAEDADLAVRVVVNNLTPTDRATELKAEVVDPSGKTVARFDYATTIRAGYTSIAERHLHVPHPQPWSPATPTLYRLVATVRSGGKTTDTSSVIFGIRTLHVSATRGLELNGLPVKLFGGNIHDDNGILGAAAFDRAEERKAELLKAAGFTAVRTAHNPPAPAFLDACDRLGLLVVEEAFDGWRKKKTAFDYSRDFNAWWRTDLDAMVLRDRNHPSVVIWSVGNEPFERTTPEGAELAHALVQEVRRLDTSRPVTAGINGVGAKGDWTQLDALFSAFDIAGYNYELARHTADRARLPSRVILSTESYQTSAFESWKAVSNDPGVVGDFVWSAMDYLGEAGIGRVFAPGETVRPHWVGSHFPWHGAACGDIDLTGFRRPLSHYRAIVWDRGERLYAAVEVPTSDGRPWQPTAWASPLLRADWTWPGFEGRTLQVEVYSRFPAVRLYLNGKLLGEKPTGEAEQFKAVFAVPYAPGELRAVGLDRAGAERESFALQTAGKPAGLTLVPDRSTLHDDGQDLAFVAVEVTDSRDHVVSDAAMPVTYALSGPGEIIAIGNADLTAPGTYHDNPRAMYEGRALVVIRTRHGEPGRLVLTATAPGLPAAEVELKAAP